MALLVSDCPRCGSNSITFDVLSQVYRGIESDWRRWFEIFCKCRACGLPTIFLVALNEYQSKDYFAKDNALVTHAEGLNRHFEIDQFISLRDNITEPPPEHLPGDIQNAFNEGAACMSIGCSNAAATMFRLCVDLVTRPLLPKQEDAEKLQPNTKTRRDLGLRLTWMFDNGILPSSLRELAKCIREDANDGAHVGSLTKEDAEDLLDFTRALLERLITEPKRLELAEARRQKRREKPER